MSFFPDKTRQCLNEKFYPQGQRWWWGVLTFSLPNKNKMKTSARDGIQSENRLFCWLWKENYDLESDNSLWLKHFNQNIMPKTKSNAAVKTNTVLHPSETDWNTVPKRVIGVDPLKMPPGLKYCQQQFPKPTSLLKTFCFEKSCVTTLMVQRHTDRKQMLLVFDLVFFIFPLKELLRPPNVLASVRVGCLTAAAAGESKNHIWSAMNFSFANVFFTQSTTKKG